MSTHNPDTYGALLELLQQLTPEQLKMKVVVLIESEEAVITHRGKEYAAKGFIVAKDTIVKP